VRQIRQRGHTALRLVSLQLPRLEAAVVTAGAVDVADQDVVAPDEDPRLPILLRFISMAALRSSHAHR
jgi:hypothetical protein